MPNPVARPLAAQPAFRRFRRALVMGGLIAAAAGPVLAQSASASPEEVHRRVLALDGHADVLLPSTPERYWLPGGGSRVDLDHLTRGGVDAIVLSVAVGPGPRDAAGVRAARADADAKLARIRAFAADNPGRVGIALSADDVERLAREGKVAVLIGFQNARSLGDDVGQIDRLYGEGVRVFGFNHAGHNSWSDSSRPSDEPVAEHGGLSDLGRRAVARLNDLGVLIDVSQLSSDAFVETLRLTRAPVAATHSNVRALVDNTRNLSDAELDAIKTNDGVVQVTPFNSYLVQPGAAQRATVSDYVDHIDYIARRIGWRHVGIGTDFDHGSGVTGFDSAAEAPNVTRELLRRGYTEDQVAAIWSGNFLRVLRAAEAARRR